MSFYPGEERRYRQVDIVRKSPKIAGAREGTEAWSRAQALHAEDLPRGLIIAYLKLTPALTYRHRTPCHEGKRCHTKRTPASESGV